MEPFWDKTIKELSPLIDYPTLNKKYLKRPPFKYILQIFISLDKKTNFTKGSFSEKELDKNTYTKAEPKMKFLKKLMVIVSNKGGKGSIVKPQSIVKGVDCEKTNEFLRELGRVAMLKNSNESKKTKKQRPGEHVRKALKKISKIGKIIIKNNNLKKQEK